MTEGGRRYSADLAHRTDGWHWQAFEKVKNRLPLKIGEGVSPTELEATEAAQGTVDSRKRELDTASRNKKTVELG